MYVHEYQFISYSRACLYITYDMIYVIHGNKITFIVIVIESLSINVIHGNHTCQFTTQSFQKKSFLKPLEAELLFKNNN